MEKYINEPASVNHKENQQHQTRGCWIGHIFSNDLVRVGQCVAKTGVIRAFLPQIE